MTPTKAPAYIHPNLLEIAFEKATRRLRDFFRLSWEVFEPGTELIPNWHLDYCAEYCEAWLAGEITDLVVNMPPREGKSSLFGVALQPWAWITKPTSKWLFNSYAKALALRDNVRARRLIQSRWYQLGWGHVFGMQPDQNEKGRFENTDEGYRIAIGAGGATGEGYDFGVCDDPQDMDQIHSENYREDTIRWFDFVWSTRKNHSGSGRLTIQQRGHDDDLSGHILEKYTGSPGFEHVKIQQEAARRKVFRFPMTGREKEVEVGELLNENRRDAAAIANLKLDLGTYGAAAQLQQEPHPPAGAIFNREWWRLYDPVRDMPEKFDLFIMSWDTAFKKGKDNAYNVGTLWGAVAEDVYLVDTLRERMNFPELRTAAKNWLERWNRALLKRFRRKVVWVLVEDEASGQDLIAEWKADKDLRGYIKAIRPSGDKIVRAHASSPMVEEGRVFIAEGTPWTEIYLKEFDSFPKGKFKDQVDSTTQALIFLKDRVKGRRVKAAAVG